MVIDPGEVRKRKDAPSNHIRRACGQLKRIDIRDLELPDGQFVDMVSIPVSCAERGRIRVEKR